MKVIVVVYVYKGVLEDTFVFYGKDRWLAAKTNVVEQAVKQVGYGRHEPEFKTAMAAFARAGWSVTLNERTLAEA